VLQDLIFLQWTGGNNFAVTRTLLDYIQDGGEKRLLSCSSVKASRKTDNRMWTQGESQAEGKLGIS
jgi:hypothetical protein